MGVNQKENKISMNFENKNDLYYYIQKKCLDAYNQGFENGKAFNGDTDNSLYDILQEAIHDLEKQINTLFITGEDKSAHLLSVTLNTLHKIYNGNEKISHENITIDSLQDELDEEIY